MKRIIIWAALGLGVLVVGLYAFGEIGRPVLYLLPHGFNGWTGIRFSDPSCKALTHESWYVVIKFDQRGRACTSTPVPSGWRYRRFEYVDADGNRRKLGGVREDVWLAGTSGPNPPHITLIFIGEEKEAKRLWGRQHEVEREMEKIFRR